ASAQTGGDTSVIRVLSTAISDRAKGYRRQLAQRSMPGLLPAAIGKTAAPALHAPRCPIPDASRAGPFLPDARASRGLLPQRPHAPAVTGPPSGSRGHTRFLPTESQQALPAAQKPLELPP